MEVFAAEIRYTSTGELCFTGRSTGEGEPEYEFKEDVDFDIELALLATLEEAYTNGLYGTGSPGQVRDMLHAMRAVLVEWDPLYEIKVPRDTKAKAEKEAEADLKALPEGSVF